MDFNLIKLVVLDVDGTMTDGGVYIDNNGVESKKFSIKDGAGIILAQSVGIDFMILTGRSSNCVQQRANELNIKYVVQGIQDKVSYLKDFLSSNCLSPCNLAYIGDDLNDLPSMHLAAISACPINAAGEILSYCDIVLQKKGGDGVVRDFIEILLKEKGLWETAKNNLFPIQ